VTSSRRARLHPRITFGQRSPPADAPGQLGRTRCGGGRVAGLPVSACGRAIVVRRLINAIPPPPPLLLLAARHLLAGPPGRSWRRQTNKMAERRAERTD